MWSCCGLLFAALQMPTWCLEQLQVYKFVYACLLLDFGHARQALAYVDVSVHVLL